MSKQARQLTRRQNFNLSCDGEERKQKKRTPPRIVAVFSVRFPNLALQSLLNAAEDFVRVAPRYVLKLNELFRPQMCTLVNSGSPVPRGNDLSNQANGIGAILLEARTRQVLRDIRVVSKQSHFMSVFPVQFLPSPIVC